MTDNVEPTPAPEPPPEETDVEIHKPKPVHNWREFLSEVGVIVLGICIALAGEQAIEWFHWRNQVQEAREVIATETANNLAGAIRRMRTVQCTEQRLDGLAKILDAASRSGSLPPVGYIGQPPRNRWLSGAWDGVVASQTATHFPRQQLADLSDIYKIVERAQDNLAQESVAWSELYTMVGPGRRLDPASEAQLRSALSRARYYNRTLATTSMFLVAEVRTMGLPFSLAELNRLDQTRTQSLTGEKASTTNLTPLSELCGPIGPVPPNYGEGPTNMSPPVVSAAAKSMPGFGSAP